MCYNIMNDYTLEVCGVVIENFHPGSWGSNCYLLTAGSHAAIVDPSADAATLLSALRERGLTLDWIALTHGHFDHIVSVDTLRQKTDAPLLIHDEDDEMLTDSRKNAFYTIFHMERTYRPADRLLHGGDLLTLGDEEVRVIHTPGHSRGSVCYLCNDEFLLTGDTLFEDAYGRYDLHGGSLAELTDSLASLRALPQRLRIYPGHGAPAQLGIALDLVAYQL